MNNEILTIKKIKETVKPLAAKYNINEVYLFGSYARGDATSESDLDFLVFGGEQFKLTMIFAFAEDLREAFDKEIDAFEINEVNQESPFYQAIMKEVLLVA